MKKSKIKFLYILIYLFFIFIIVLSVAYILNFFLLKKEAQKENNLLNIVKVEENTLDNNDSENDNNENEESTNSIENTTNTVEEKEDIENPENGRILQVKNLKKQNSDIVGWLEIKDTSINYPVLQGTDNEYYMTHNYKKQKSKKGSIFLTKDYDWNIPSNNLLIYGHNLKNGTMFEELLKYSDKNFYKKHPIIRFTTENEDAEYEIISVFKSRVYYKSEKNVFRYYYFVNANTEEEYNEFIKNAKKASLYDIEATAKYKDQLITLSTCSYHTQDGRFAVVGRKIEKNS